MRRSLVCQSLAAFFLLASCTGERPAELEISAEVLAEAQEELRAVVDSIAADAMSANIPGLQAAHLDSDKFSKFGPRTFDRQDVASANASEADFFSSISDLQYEARDLKIDVFGDVGIATYYPHVSFVQAGEKKQLNGRQTLVFLRTPEGWKIVHEHGTIQK